MGGLRNAPSVGYSVQLYTEASSQRHRANPSGRDDGFPKDIFTTSEGTDGRGLVEVAASSTADDCSEGAVLDPGRGVWESQSSGAEWIALRLEAPVMILKIRISWARCYASQFRIVATVPGKGERSVYDTWEGTGGTQVVELPQPVAATGLRLELVAPGRDGGAPFGCYSIYRLAAEAMPVESGAGLHASYFREPAARRAAIERLEPLEHGFGAAGTSGASFTAARYEGWLKVGVGGVYTFQTESAHTVGLTLDGAAWTGDRVLHAGGHELRVEVLRAAEDVDLVWQVSWSGPVTGDELTPLTAAVLAPLEIHDSSLYALRTVGFQLDAFDPSQCVFTVPLLPHHIESAKVEAIPRRNSAIVRMGRSEAALEAAPLDLAQPIPLAVGQNRLLVRVIAEDRRTVTDTELLLNRAPCDGTALGFLRLAVPGVTGFWFQTSNLSETEIVVPSLPYSALFCRVIADPKSNAGEIYICKGPGRHNLQEEAYKVPPGSYSASMGLHVGQNIIYVLVHSESRAASRIWTLLVTRSASSDCSLRSVAVSPGNTPAPGAFQLDHPPVGHHDVPEVIPAGFADAYIHAEANHTDARIYVATGDPRRAWVQRGQHRLNAGQRGGAGLRIRLRVGANRVYLLVIAQDNFSREQYSFDVHREPPHVPFRLALAYGAEISAADFPLIVPLASSLILAKAGVPTEI